MQDKKPLLKDSNKEKNNKIKSYTNIYKNLIIKLDDNNNYFCDEKSLINNKDEDIEFEKYSRDKLIFEFFIQKLILFF